jgi:L-ascorbate metabolism protein UlaG (beta-lactamase superfamily)
MGVFYKRPMNIKKACRILPYIKSKRFYNGPEDRPENLLFHTIPSLISSLIGRKKRMPANLDNWLCPTAEITERSHTPLITWIGHATFLIQIGGINILTDPLFGSPSVLFPRISPCGIAPESLPPIDVVLLSHNHRDHCDEPSLQLLADRHDLHILAPSGDKKWLDTKNFGRVSEYMWWDKMVFPWQDQSITFTFLPAAHWSQRKFFDRNCSLWGSWMIQHASRSVYFAGDTAYSPHFASIAQEFPSIDMALMPIAPCEPGKWMERTHMNATQAIQAFIELKAKQFIPMHWGTFLFGKDHFEGPIMRLQKSWADCRKQVVDRLLHIPKIGQVVSV